MDLLHVITQSEKQAKDVAHFLLKEKLVLDSLLMEKVLYIEEKDMVPHYVTLVKARTKHLLFNTIDEKLRQKYKDDMPILYSVPIVSMDKDQAQELVNLTARA